MVIQIRQTFPFWGYSKYMCVSKRFAQLQVLNTIRAITKVVVVEPFWRSLWQFVLFGFLAGTFARDERERSVSLPAVCIWCRKGVLTAVVGWTMQMFCLCKNDSKKVGYLNSHHDSSKKGDIAK